MIARIIDPAEESAMLLSGEWNLVLRANPTTLHKATGEVRSMVLYFIHSIPSLDTVLWQSNMNPWVNGLSFLHLHLYECRRRYDLEQLENFHYSLVRQFRWVKGCDVRITRTGER